MAQKPLKFIVAPHIVQDLGLNLYTSLPRVLVEFVANAYDADSPYAKIELDTPKIEQARKSLKAEWELEVEQNGGNATDVKPLSERALSEDIQITIKDAGHGMSREDLRCKFLVAGRRRRTEDKRNTSRNGRVLMGRKGLGKLAGFGVAQLITVISKKENESHATKIELDYKELIKVKETNEIPITEECLEDGGGFGQSGTKIILSKLLYEPMKSRLSTIENRIGDHFCQIELDDFCVQLNGGAVEPKQRNYAYGWPEPEKNPEELVDGSYETEDGKKCSFQYRLRFTEDRAALTASDRGIRVYAHKRLASAPSLLDADTNMHGFRMTDYLDGVVYADFIDEQGQDYTATDRHSLRWESPLLMPLRKLLSDEIKLACQKRQKKRDEENKNKVRDDDFTKKVIAKAGMTKKGEIGAYRIAVVVSGLHKKGLEDDGYKNQFKEVVRGLGKGEILTTLSALAEQDNPELNKVIAEITRLNAEEIDGFYQFVKGRISGIKALSKIVEGVDFKAKDNEKIIQKMFEASPWMIDPTYTQFLTADKGLSTLFTRLAKHLKIGAHAPSGSENDNKRPDLVFLLGSESLNRLVIVELKSANKSLDVTHLNQLQFYMQSAKEWLENQKHTGIIIQGHLIGTKAPPDSMREDVVTLRARIDDAGPDTRWTVRDYLNILADTEAAHQELLQLSQQTDDIGDDVDAE